MRAPLFEEKVVNFLVELAKVTDKTVPREELYQEEEERQRGRLTRRLRAAMLARIVEDEGWTAWLKSF